jgi:hypothetical protein
VELKANRGLCNCVIGVRAKPCERGALELAFELYPMERARSMAIEAPAVHS